MDFMKKKTFIEKQKKGEQILEILNVASFFAHTSIRIGLFSSIISDRSELKAAITFLKQQSLVKCPEETKFLIPKSIGDNLRHHLGISGEKEIILKKAILVLSKARFMDYPHLVSFYNYAKEIPKVLEELDELPGKAIILMTEKGKYLEAVAFGKECCSYLTEFLGENHKTVFDLEVAFGLALAMTGKREDSIKVLITAYEKSCKYGSYFDFKCSMFALSQVILSDTLPFKRNISEIRLRNILFPGLSISESSFDLELQKWRDYAKMLQNLGLPDNALSIIEDVIKRRNILFGQDDGEMYIAMELKAKTLADEPSKLFLKEAMELLKYIYEKKKKIFGRYNIKTLNTMINIGNILFLQRNLKEAMSLFEDVIRNFKKIDDESILLYKLTVTYMIDISEIQGDFLKALKLSLDLREKCESIYGDIHPHCLTCRKKQIDLYLKLKRPQKALEVLKNTVEDCKYEYEEKELECFYLEMQNIKNTWSFDTPAGTLHSLAKIGNSKTLLSLIESGKDIESKDSTGLTPLHYASAFGQVEVARILIKKGAKNPLLSPSGFTPLEVAKGRRMKKLLNRVHSFYEAVKTNNLDGVLEIALKEPCVLGAKDDQGRTPLHWAAQQDNGTVLRLLLEFDSDPTVVSDRGNSPLHIAVSKGREEIADILLRALGPNVATALLDGKTSIGGNTPLHAAASKGHSAMVRVLLGHGAIWSTMNSPGKTPLQVSEDEACRNLLGLIESLFLDTIKGDIEAVCAKLDDLECGDVIPVSKARDADHRNLLQMAMKQKNLDLVKKLVKVLK